MKIETLKQIKTHLEKLNKKYNFVFSWIGLKKSDYTVFPIVISKEHEDYLKKLKLRWDDSPYGNAPVGMSIKTGEPKYSNNTLEDKKFELVYELLKEKNFLSMISIPLFNNNGQVFGAFVAYKDEINFFTQEKIEEIKKDIQEIGKDLANIFKEDIQIEERLNEYLNMLYDMITYINKGTASDVNPEYIAIDILNDLDKLLDADGSELIVYNKSDNKLELIAASDLFLENFEKHSFNIDVYGGLSPSVKHYMEKEDAANIDYEKDPYASKWFIDKGLKFINYTSINAHVYDKNTSSMLILVRKKEHWLSEIELNILKLINQALFSVFVIGKYLKDIGSLRLHIEEITTKDPLTGFYNKEMFDLFLKNEINKTISRNMPNTFSCILIDIDNFRYVNEAYGYQAGDMIIQKLADIIKTKTRNFDILARTGGDEFGIIMPDTKIQSAKLIMEDINETLKYQPISIGDIEVYINVSAGISTCLGKDEKNQDQLVCSKEEVKMFAEEALREAKRSGKSNVVIANPKNKNQSLTLSKYDLINKAINENLIEPAFQPIYDLKANTISGFEALCRIKIDNNIIYPDAFIEDAEELGLINKIDLTMIEKACARVSKLNNKDLHLFVNISAKAFKDEHFFEKIVDISKTYKMQNRLYVEITEREHLSNLENFQKVEEFLKYYGVRFVIDDFGSGYSSFLYLKFMRTDILKIDGAFVKNIVADNTDKAIVTGIDTIAKELGTKTLAEFIEDEDALKELKNIGIDYGQGYYLGRPTFDLESML
jgi:diguanylate cyclase (GGDEF)-like protein